MAISGRFLYRAVAFKVVQGRGTAYRLADDPIFFFLYVAIYIASLLGGLALLVQGWRNSTD